MRRFMLRNGMGTIVLVTILGILSPAGVLAQAGQVQGRVIHAETGETLSAVQLSLQGTGLGVLSGSDGEFTIANVPAGTHVILGQRLGFQPLRQENVTVQPGQTVTVDLLMRPAVLALQGIVATGLVDPVEGVRSPIAVARVSREMMPVTVAGSAVQNLQGMVPGVLINRRSGAPGEGVGIVLRTPTSVTGSPAPLIVVDGIILGDTETTDIEGLDIESIEVIRGAAASSLYGSRAAAGVIAITTNRGSGLDMGRTQFSVRSEIGVSQALAHDYLANHHHYLMDPTNSFYVNAQGEPVARNQRVAPPENVAFMDKPFPDPIYNNVAAVSRPGGFASQNAAISGNTASTNFAVTLNRYLEEGALVGNDGYHRNSFRVNLDHRFDKPVTLGVSVYHARAGLDGINTNAFTSALLAPQDVDFSKRDENGNYLQQPDPTIPLQNPLWTNATRDNSDRSIRTLVGGTLTWNPFFWMTLAGSAGYDRGDNESRTYVPKGTPANVGQEGELDGSLSLSNSSSDAWNAEAQVSLRRDFGPLNVRTTGRALMERSESKSGVRSGQNFILYDVPQLSNIPPQFRNATSSEAYQRATGYLWDTALDYDARYVLTLLGRRDGSSLFGDANRWHNYYRVAGAWRIGEEDWFNLPRVTEFKVSLARGTAGGRPNQTAQYETWALSGGIPTKSSLGNRFLAPEHTTENEISLNVILDDRIGVVLTHARQETRDQLVQSPQAVITGYTTQWVNAGVVSGHTTELQIEGQILRRANLGWTSMFVADYSDSYIKEWNIPCQVLNWRYHCEGEPMYGIYSISLVNGERNGLEGALAKHRGGDALPYIDQFDVNDEGYVVWVGQGNTWRDGIAKDLWGTTSGDIGGRTYDWGHTFWEQTEVGNNRRQLVGESVKFNLGWVNIARIGALSLQAHMSASLGAHVNNRRVWTLANPRTGLFMDQAGRPEHLKKPVSYYLFSIQGDGDYTIKRADWLKLRSVSANYRIDRNRLDRLGLGFVGVESMTLGLVSRNVFIITNFDGFDPEFGLNLVTRQNADTSGNAGGYPTTRSFTFDVSVTF